MWFRKKNLVRKLLTAEYLQNSGNLLPVSVGRINFGHILVHFD